MFNKTLQRIIDEIVGKTFNTLRFNLLGPDRVSKAFVLSLKGSTYDPHATLAGAYLQANLQHSNNPSSIDKKTINSLVDVAEKYIDNLQQKSTADINRIIAQHASDLSMQAKLAGVSERDLLLGDTGDEIIKKLKADLKDQKEKIDKAASLIAEHERHQAYNYGATDGIFTAARSIGIDDPTVLKILVDDERTCKKCRGLWLLPNTETPRLYKLSELAASPGPDYKNPVASISPSHINCRCVITTLLPGFGLNPEGSIVYKGTDPDTGKPWDEYSKQKR